MLKRAQTLEALREGLVADAGRAHGVRVVRVSRQVSE